MNMLSFKFRTNEPSGLIFLTMGTKPPKVTTSLPSIQSDRTPNHPSPEKPPTTQNDFVAVELLNGHIYLHVDFGSGANKVRCSRRRADDGAWHDLVVRRNGRDFKVSVDGTATDYRVSGETIHLELGGPVYLGGTGDLYGGSTSLPPSVWTATLRQGFVGCLRELSLSGKTVDIAAFARQQDTGEFRVSTLVRERRKPHQ